MATTMTVKEIAEKLGTEPRTLRKFLRSEVVEKGGKIGEDTPGKGGRYAIEARSFASLSKRFATWQEAHTRSAETDELSDEDVLDEVDA